MPYLILRSSDLVKDKPWVLQLRYNESYGTPEYVDLVHVSEGAARAIVDAGKPFFLFGDPEKTK